MILSLVSRRTKNEHDWRAQYVGQECGELCNPLLVQRAAKPTVRKTVSRRLQYFLCPAIFHLEVNLKCSNPAKRRYHVPALRVSLSNFTSFTALHSMKIGIQFEKIGCEIRKFILGTLIELILFAELVDLMRQWEIEK